MEGSKSLVPQPPAGWPNPQGQGKQSQRVEQTGQDHGKRDTNTPFRNALWKAGPLPLDHVIHPEIFEQ